MRHVCGISGGKDSAALAIYLKEKGVISDIEYFFLIPVASYQKLMTSLIVLKPILVKK